MNLPVPNVGIDPGPDWANNLNASLSIIDQHTHASGSGIPITPSGLNINSALPIQNNDITGIGSLVFNTQTTLSTLNALYVKGIDLYFNDGSGDPAIQITAGGAVNATTSGISSGTATASFVSGVLVVNAASTTPANIQGGSILLGNNTAGSKFLTLAPPNAMAANYSLTLPSVPGVKSIMALDSSGNMSAPYTVDGSTIAISANVIGIPAGGVGTAQIAANAVTRPKMVAVGQQISGSCGAYGLTNTTSFTDVTNLSVTITTTGRPVMLIIQHDGVSSSNLFSYGFSSSLSGISSGSVFQFVRSTNAIALYQVEAQQNSSGNFQSAALVFLDVPSAGTYTYKLQAKTLFTGSSQTAFINYGVLVAYEL